MDYNNYNRFAAAATAVLVVVILAGHSISADDDAPICGATPAKDQATFGGYVDALLHILVERTTGYTPPAGVPFLASSARYPPEGGPGSVTGDATCDSVNVANCVTCLNQLLPFLHKCETTSSSGGAKYPGKCIIQFWENTE
ncbi:unnamed protein product [Linum trigynum]|uniref:Gnk2-homologous domain-containing protein n=1 Tax=Linum trigynum TaxID=586398 RepID=A0AAV2FII4_9ROSI